MKHQMQIALFILLVLTLTSCVTTTQPQLAKSTYKNESPSVVNTKNHESEVITRQQDDALVILAASGGGHRAAHYTIGALLAYSQLPIKYTKDKPSTLLEEIDVVSSVSGGSYGIAAYLAAYIEAQCNGSENIHNTLELLRADPERLRVLASAWYPQIFKGLNPLNLSENKRNVDQLVKGFHSKIVSIKGCKRNSKERNTPFELLVGHVTNEEEVSSRIKMPFLHIVNATNSVSGKVFSFYHNGISKDDYEDITCYQLHGKHKPVEKGQIPYKLAVASSAAFPPVVTDTLFSINENSNCNKGAFLRLTDGGQADDNGIDSALNYVKQELQENSKKKALLLSIDSSIETYKTTKADKKEMSVLRVALERNADLPRYHKKRKQKEDIANCDQTSPVLMETFTNGQSLFAVSTGFAQDSMNDKVGKENDHGENKAENKGCQVKNYRGGTLVFNYDDETKAPETNSSFQSNISTFSNADGLTMEQRITGVAEGYYQATHKLLKTTPDFEQKLKKQALSIAFILHCFKEDGRKIKEFSRCNTFYDLNKDYLSYCFLESTSDGKNKSIARHSGRPICMGKPRKIENVEYDRQLVLFNNIQELKYKNKLDNQKNRIKQARNIKAIKLVKAQAEAISKELNDLITGVEKAEKAFVKTVNNTYHRKIKELSDTLVNPIFESTGIIQLINDAKLEIEGTREYLKSELKLQTTIKELSAVPSTFEFELDEQDEYCVYSNKAISLKQIKQKVCPPQFILSVANQDDETTKVQDKGFSLTKVFNYIFKVFVRKQDEVTIDSIQKQLNGLQRKLTKFHKSYSSINQLTGKRWLEMMNMGVSPLTTKFDKVCRDLKVIQVNTVTFTQILQDAGLVEVTIDGDEKLKKSSSPIESQFKWCALSQRSLEIAISTVKVDKTEISTQMDKVLSMFDEFNAVFNSESYFNHTSKSNLTPEIFIAAQTAKAIKISARFELIAKGDNADQKQEIYDAINFNEWKNKLDVLKARVCHLATGLDDCQSEIMSQTVVDTNNKPTTIVQLATNYQIAAKALMTKIENLYEKSTDLTTDTNKRKLKIKLDDNVLNQFEECIAIIDREVDNGKFLTTREQYALDKFFTYAFAKQWLESAGKKNVDKCIDLIVKAKI